LPKTTLQGETMALFSSGLQAEDRLVTLLEKYGCHIHRSELLDQKHKLDFVILKLPHVSQLLEKSLGIQMTTRVGDAQKRAAFLDRVAQNPYAAKNLYLELPNRILEDGVSFTVLVAATQFLTDKAFIHQPVAAVRINEDLTYEFTSIESGRAATIRPPALHRPQAGRTFRPPIAPPRAFPAQPIAPIISPRPQAVSAQPCEFPTWGDYWLECYKTLTLGAQLLGTVTSYDTAKKMGFLRRITFPATEGVDESDLSALTFFFHMTDITDKNLLDALNKTPFPKYKPGQPAFNPFPPVTFTVGEWIAGKSCPKALRVRWDV
jgi:hypothetical protein